MTESLCHKCLKADARQRDDYARRLSRARLFDAAFRETQASDRYRELIQESLDEPCRFHERRVGLRRSDPEPTVRPPGIYEMEAG